MIVAKWNVNGIRARATEVAAWIERERPDVDCLQETTPWRNARARNLGWRLDYIFASAPLAKCATSCVVQADCGTSDHAPVIAMFAHAG